MQERLMLRALALARKGLGFTSPNPVVGAVIEKGGKIVGEGYHRKAGGDHAEIVAIKQVMKKSGIKTVDLDPTLFHNAVLYVTLEPCSHSAKTPACAKAIVAAGFKKVCVGMKDPFEKVNGRGIKYLRDRGVEVELCKPSSALAKDIRAVNQSFIKWVSLGLPYLTLKAGMSLDGKIATVAGESKWITSEDSRKDARLERSLCDAVLIGTGTANVDTPELAAHGKFAHKSLLRVVIDSRLSLSLKLNIFRDENVFVACSALASARNKSRFAKAGVEFKSFGKNEVSLKKLLGFLADRYVQSVFVEGGSSVHGRFVAAAVRNPELVDRALFYIAPMIIGGKNSLGVIGGDGTGSLSKALGFDSLDVSPLGEDFKAEGFLNLY